MDTDESSFCSQKKQTLTLFGPGFLYKHRAVLAGVAPGEGCFIHPLHNSFVFKVRLLKLYTELLSDKMNILRQSGSN